jgi:hypothetical protein
MIDPVPVRTRERVPGPSLVRTVYVTFISAALTLASGIAMMVAIVVTQSTFDNPVVATLATILAACLVGGVACTHFAKRASKAETAAGYTTSRFGYPQLELVDPSTNLIVRAADEPLISRDEYRRRVQAYRTMVLEADDA